MERRPIKRTLHAADLFQFEQRRLGFLVQLIFDILEYGELSDFWCRRAKESLPSGPAT